MDKLPEPVACGLCGITYYESDCMEALIKEREKLGELADKVEQASGLSASQLSAEDSVAEIVKTLIKRAEKAEADLLKERERAESLARAVMNDQVSNDQALSDGSQYVYKVSFPSGESCFFGLESTAKAYARESGTVSQVKITKRDFRFVSIETKEAYQKQSAVHYDKYIAATKRAEKAEAEAAALRELLISARKYMSHSASCESGYDCNAHNCDCGHDKLLEQISAAIKEQP